MDNKFILRIILGAVLVMVCSAAPNIFSFLTPGKKEVRVEPRVEVVQGPSFVVQGAPNHVVHGSTHVVHGPTHVVHGAPTHVVHGAPTHVVHGAPTHVVHGVPSPVIVGHVVPGQPYPHPVPHPVPHPPPIYRPGTPEQCICTEPSNCRKTHGLHRCSGGKVNFNNIGPEVCCPPDDVIC